MKRKKIYDLVKRLLTDYAELRDSDKKLIWKVWHDLGFSESSYGAGRCIYYSEFLKAPSTETIRRCRQKIQELHPELQSSGRVRKLRHQKEEQKGTFIYSEEVRTQEKLI